MQREWAEAKKELQEERENARRLSLERESSLKEALRKEEELRKELADAKQSLEAAKSIAADAKVLTQKNSFLSYLCLLCYIYL